MPPTRTTIGLSVLRVPEIPLYTGDMDADLETVSRNRLAERITGGLSRPSKLPCPAWGISATRCRIGQTLATHAGTVCAGCYAMKGHYRFPNVQRKLEQRFQGLRHPLWTPAMVFLVRYFCDRYFRLFDSGDLQGVNMLRNIITLANHVPDVQIWLPTREYETVQACRHDIPDNLTIRVSSHLTDQEPPAWWPTTSTVVTDQSAGNGVCPSKDQDNLCEDCRACWDREVPNVAYRLH